MKNLFSIISICLFLTTNIFYSQKDDSWKVFDDSQVAEVRITMDPVDLKNMFDNPYSNIIYTSKVKFKNLYIDETIDGVGIRIRGDASRNSKKKSLKLKFNAFLKPQKFYTLKDINLNAFANDPTTMRGKISWDLYKDMGLISSRASHAEVYINDKYYGIYINVEQIDDEFLKKNYENSKGNLWKCLHQASLNYISDNPEDYKFIYETYRPYDLQTNKELDDYSMLAKLTRTIQYSPGESLLDTLSQIINIDDILKNFTFDLLSGNWDDFWFGWNNYYLYYEPTEEKFRFIPYDYDNSFGITFGTYTDFATRNIYNWQNNNKFPVLYQRIMNNPSIRNLLTHYLEYYSSEVYSLSLWESRSDRIKNMITPYAERATIWDWGYTIQDFHKSYAFTGYFFDKALKMRRSIKEFVNVRNSSLLNQIQYLSSPPIIYESSINREFFYTTDSVTVFASAFSNMGISNIWVELEEKGVIKESFPMTYSPVLRTKQISEADRWETSFLPIGDWGKSKLRIVAKDLEGKITKYPLKGFPLTRIQKANKNIYINEVLSTNLNTNQDEYGDFDDWLEIYNQQDSSIDLSGYYLTDDKRNLTKYKIPLGTVMDPYSYKLFWCDDETVEGNKHTNFKLSAKGEFLALIDVDGITIIDSLTFPSLRSDISFGRNLDIDSNWHYFVVPTPEKNNNLPRKEKSSEILINELMSNNIGYFRNANKLFSDWVELYNPQDTPVVLSGKYLTDSKLFWGKWKFPMGVSLGPGEYMLVWCDNDTSSIELHSNFNLSSQGEYIALVDKDGFSIVDSINFPNLPVDFSYGRSVDNPNNWQIFVLPTPKSYNRIIPHPQTSEVLINELMSTNLKTITDEYDEFEDWVEIYNPQDSVVNLSGKYLTDDINFLNKWRIPDSTFINSKEYLLYWCDNNSSQGKNHTNFRLNSAGEFLAIINDDGVSIIDSLTFPNLNPDVSYGRLLELDYNWRYFAFASPGFSNYKEPGNRTSEILINELMSSNEKIIQDEMGEFEDWVEIYNPSNSSVDLSGKFFTDNKFYLGKWQFPQNTVIDPNGYLLIWCDNDSAITDLHSNFQLNSNGEYIAILDTDAVTIIDSITFPIIPTNISYGRNLDVDSLWHFFVYPTPKFSNYIAPKVTISKLVLNELMSNNIDFITDDKGSYSDWIEIYNPTETAIDISSKFLTDDKLFLGKWKFPNNTFIQPHEYILVWCDNDNDTINLHTAFQLSSSGEYLAFLEEDAVSIIDSVTFPLLNGNESYARLDTSNVTWQISTNPTPGSGNIITKLNSLNKPFSNIVNIYPNPFNPSTTIEFESSTDSEIKISIFNILGELIWDNSSSIKTGKHQRIWNGKNNSGHAMPSGTYFLMYESKNLKKTIKLLLLR